ncbi:cobalt ECF transporter T component CbiQ [Treponema primitia]|uniref:cobalt ECF transporter T component CbiQ n=1 Tax=Treponema primitia TaxID=88058 RepID=UPI00398104C3
MPDIARTTETLYTLEQLAAGRSGLHRLNPGVKILATLFFMVTVISFDRYSLGRIVPFLFYPCILIAWGDIPPGLLLRRTALALPFCLFAGISNLIFERGIAVYLGSFAVSFGLLSLVTLLLRTLLCVAAVLILMAVTPLCRLAAQLRCFHCPALFVSLLEISYRYIAVLIAEASSMYTAYILRSGDAKGIELKHMGSFIGHLFLRSSDRAERVYAAMKCRGYDLDFPAGKRRPLNAADITFLALVCGLCILFRLMDISAILGSWIIPS